jgi:lipoate-protein ligase A
VTPSELKMQAWRLLELEYPNAPANLALEEALARQIGGGKSPPTLRLWRNRNAAIIGENQSASLELNLDACRELGVEVVRRFTGGGAVYHDLGNLNYSICAPRPSASDLILQQGLFKRALDCAVTCLRMLGIEASQAPVNAVVVGSRKISGGAGAIRWGAVFYHGSILISTDLEVVWKILRREQPPTDSRFVKSKRLPMTSLEKESGREIPLNRVENAVKDAFVEVFNATLVPGPVTEQELHAASGLVEEKYGRDDWNLRL